MRLSIAWYDLVTGPAPGRFSSLDRLPLTVTINASRGSPSQTQRSVECNSRAPADSEHVGSKNSCWNRTPRRIRLRDE